MIETNVCYDLHHVSITVTEILKVFKIDITQHVIHSYSVFGFSVHI